MILELPAVPKPKKFGLCATCITLLEGGGGSAGLQQSAYKRLICYAV